MQINSGCLFFFTCYIITRLCVISHITNLLDFSWRSIWQEQMLIICLYLMFPFQGCASCLCLNWRRRWRKWRLPSGVTVKSWSRLWLCEMNWIMKRRYFHLKVIEKKLTYSYVFTIVFYCISASSARVSLKVFLNPGEEQLHLAADRRAEQAEGAPGAAAEKEENQKHHNNRAQRPESDEHAHPGNGESRQCRRHKDPQDIPSVCDDNAVRAWWLDRSLAFLHHWGSAVNLLPLH